MDKPEDKSKRSFFGDRRQLKNLSRLIMDIQDKLFQRTPFSLLMSQEIRDYAADLVSMCKVSEDAIGKILLESFEPASIISDVIGDDPELTGPGEAIFEGYTKAIEEIEALVRRKEILEDKIYSGSTYRHPRMSLEEAIQDDIDDLKQKRAKWADLFYVHFELKKDPIPITTRQMIENQAYCLFAYIENCISQAGLKTRGTNADIHELLSELFSVIYDHPAFNSDVRFHPTKIKEYCDNGKRNRRMKKSPLRKSLESL